MQYFFIPVFIPVYDPDDPDEILESIFDVDQVTTRPVTIVLLMFLQLKTIKILVNPN